MSRPLLIRFTTPMISGCHEPLELTIMNVLSMSLLQVLLVAYLGTEADWSNWKVDLGLGSLAGMSLAVAQGFTSPGTDLATTFVSTITLAVGGALALVGIRRLKERRLSWALVSAALLAAAMTMVISAMDCISWT